MTFEQVEQTINELINEYDVTDTEYSGQTNEYGMKLDADGCIIVSEMFKAIQDAVGADEVSSLREILETEDVNCRFYCSELLAYKERYYEL